ncbi:MAG TPA: primosomal protein N' [Phycisphaerae bacterium]|nr:primosomal protein N' [Phycisphaerae bacterium]
MPISHAERATPSFLEEVRARTGPVATVALLKPAEVPYSYRISDEMVEAIAPGMRVTVPFGRKGKPVPAFCLRVSDEPWDSTLKPILSVIDEKPLLSQALIELGEWTATYYAANLGRTLDLMIPAAVKRQAGTKRVRYVSAVSTDEIRGERTSKPTTPKQAAVLRVLRGSKKPIPIDDLLREANCTEAIVKSLEKSGLVQLTQVREQVRPAGQSGLVKEPDFELNGDQKRAIAQINSAIESAQFSVEVLFGVTGSGKTEVYVAAIRRALELGRQAIMLVPEIALTTQTVERLSRRFERVATIHSGMSDVQRSRTWSAVASGDIPVVIGTRSAVFAPCPTLGVIIVDEEAEPSYKSQASPRYHTRDVAVKRGHIEGIPVVLGSATPSLETWSNVQRRKHYHLIRMPRRVRGLAMPKMHLVDMAEEHRARRGVHMLSRAMEEQLRETLQRGEQAVILLNRRGYASYLHCAKCRTVLCCPHCSVRLVFHQSTKLGHCHYCHSKLIVPAKCQNLGCGGTMVKFGLGTERVEEEIANRFTDARVRRIDSDAMHSAADYARVLGGFERREFDVLVGTQMVAKGLDFPFVSFVGVISADTALAMDDFRSEERTFQLVLQVAGRSGRAETGGSVVVQTFAADTAPIRHAIKGDYEGFAKLELQRRRELNLPPFTRMMRVILADGHISRVKAAAKKMAEDVAYLLGRHKIAATVFDPHPSPIERIRDQYRYDVLLNFPTAAGLVSAVAVLKDEGVFRAKVKNVTIDVDPVSLQ